MIRHVRASSLIRSSEQCGPITGIGLERGKPESPALLQAAKKQSRFEAGLRAERRSLHFALQPNQGLINASRHVPHV